MPVECFLAPGSFADVSALQTFDWDLPAGSEVIGDAAYNHYEMEDLLHEAADIHLRPIRKKNSQRVQPPWERFVLCHVRKRVETAGSLVERMMPKSIHAVTAKGFELKVLLFIAAYSLSFLV